MQVQPSRTLGAELFHCYSNIITMKVIILTLFTFLTTCIHLAFGKTLITMQSVALEQLQNTTGL